MYVFNALVEAPHVEGMSRSAPAGEVMSRGEAIRKDEAILRATAGVEHGPGA